MDAPRVTRRKVVDWTSRCATSAAVIHAGKVLLALTTPYRFQSKPTAQDDSRPTCFFWLCCIVVLMVSVHDAALIVVNHEVISEVEQNPFGRWLLDLQHGDVWLFVSAKLLGTSLVCAILIEIHRYSQRLGVVIAHVLAVFQCLLLYLLTCG